MADIWKQSVIYEWLKSSDNYKNGVINSQVKERFGEEYMEAWEELKRKKNLMFFENKRWYSWHVKI